MTNDDQALADEIADDMSEFIWRVREGLYEEALLQPDAAVSRATTAFEAGETPIVLADYSDRTGDAIWIFNFLFAEGANPAPPYPECGEDPTPDDGLGCEAYPMDSCP